jgi:hypothetical protein
MQVCVRAATTTGSSNTGAIVGGVVGGVVGALLLAAALARYLLWRRHKASRTSALPIVRNRSDRIYYGNETSNPFVTETEVSCIWKDNIC